MYIEEPGEKSVTSEWNRELFWSQGSGGKNITSTKTAGEEQYPLSTSQDLYVESAGTKVSMKQDCICSAEW